MALPPFEEYKTPWETKGEDYDPEKGRRFIYWLLTKNEQAEADKKAVEAERDEVSTKLADKEREGETEAQRRERELEELRQRESENAKQSEALKALKLDVALDLDGVSAKDAKFIAARLSGTNREEIEADAKIFLEKFGKQKESSDKEPEDGDPQGGPRRQPRSSLRTSGDPKPEERRGPSDREVVLNVIPRPHGF